MPRHILRGTLVLPEGLLEHGSLVVEDGLIAAAGEFRGQPTQDLGDCFIAPGFIDLHVHGIAGADTMAAGDGSLAVMARALARHGVTAFLPTTVTAGLGTLAAVMRDVDRYMGRQEKEGLPGARVLGVHLEGPWISPEFKGAQNGKYILEPTGESLMRLLASPGAGAVRIVSLAPELPGAEECIAVLRRHGIKVSMGHTGATYEEALRAVDLGATGVTHCFNAMTGLHHRAPGVAGAALLAETLTAELIADGIHVHPAVMRLLIRARGREKVILVSDAVAAADLPEGHGLLGEREIRVRHGRASLADGTLAGSVLTLDQAVRNLVRWCAVPLADAVCMAAAAPAAAIGLDGRKGCIRAGYDADLVVLDRDLQPVRVFVGGRQIFLPPAGKGAGFRILE